MSQRLDRHSTCARPEPPRATSRDFEEEGARNNTDTQHAVAPSMQSPRHPSPDDVDQGVAALALPAKPRAKASGLPENALSRSLGYSRGIGQALRAWNELGLGHLLVPEDALGGVCGADDAQEGAAGSATGASTAQSRACIMSDILCRYNMDPSWAGSDNDGACDERPRRRTRSQRPGPLALTGEGYDLEMESGEEGQPKTGAQTGASPTSSKAQGVPIDDDDVVIVVEHTTSCDACLLKYVNGATAKAESAPPSNRLYEEDRAVLVSWGGNVAGIVVPGNSDGRRGRGKSRDEASDRWFTDSLIDFGVSLYVGTDKARRFNKRMALLAPSYYPLYINGLRRHGDPCTTMEWKANMVSAAQSYGVFRRSGSLLARGDRSPWDTDGVYMPVFVVPNHWILVVVTNLRRLHTILDGKETRPLKKRGNEGAPRIIIVDSNAQRSPLPTSSHHAVAEKIQHWVASVYMHSQGCSEEPWKCGMFRWVAPPGSNLMFSQVRSAVRGLLLVLLPPCPKQKDLFSCGPYTLLALYFLSGKHLTLCNVADLADMRPLLLASAYNFQDAANLASNMADAVRVLAERQREKDQAGDTATETGLTAVQSMAALFKTPFVSRTSLASGAPHHVPTSIEATPLLLRLSQLQQPHKKKKKRTKV